MPGLFLGRELQEKSANTVAAWFEVLRAGGPYAALLVEASARSAPAVVAEVAGGVVRRPRSVSTAGAIKAALEGCERGSGRILRSERYCAAQGRLVNALATFRIHESELADTLLRLGHIPTRADTDDMGRLVHDLRRDLRALRRQVEEIDGRIRDRERPREKTPEPVHG
jgi:hypothetical protein